MSSMRVGSGPLDCNFGNFSDIDECSRPDACGNNAICRNTPGNYTCDCQPGFVGNPYDGVIIISIYYNIIIFLIH